VKPLKIACMGEAMIEIIANSEVTSASLGVAGDSMNTAIYLKRNIGSEHEVAFVSMVGQDAFSDRIVEFIASEGVRVDYLRRHHDRLPGIYSVNTNASGERSFSYWRESSAARTMYTASNGHDISELGEFDVVFMSAISLAILSRPVRDQLFKWIKTFRTNGGRFAFDSNYRPALWPDQDEARYEVTRAWSHCDIALPSVDDEMALFGDVGSKAVIDRLIGNGVRFGALKQGAEGPLPIGVQSPTRQDFAKAGSVIDTTAAGDSFNGAFLASHLSGENLDQSMQAGHNMAIRVIAHRGAIL